MTNWKLAELMDVMGNYMITNGIKQLTPEDLFKLSRGFRKP